MRTKRPTLVINSRDPSLLDPGFGPSRSQSAGSPSPEFHPEITGPSSTPSTSSADPRRRLAVTTGTSGTGIRPPSATTTSLASSSTLTLSSTTNSNLVKSSISSPSPTSSSASNSTPGTKLPIPGHQKIRTRPSLKTLEPVPESDARTPRRPTPVMATPKSKSLSKPNSQYFYAALHERSGDVVGDLVRGEAMVMAELKTNVKIEDEYAFTVEFSHDLARRYNRSVDSIIVTVDHGRCMLFAGSMDPAYTLTISALPSEVQKVTNKRNTAVMQRYMESALGVHCSRGFIRFIPVGEECVGWGGKTVLGRIGDAGGRVSPEPDERIHDRRILKSISLRKAAPAEATPPATPSKMSSVRGSTSSSPSSKGMLPTRAASTGNPKPLRKKKSLVATIFRTNKYESNMASIPQDGES